MAEFAPFPNPRNPGDMPLVSTAGPHYRCNGCGEIGDWHGRLILETVDANDQVIGIRVTRDREVAPDHACGSEAVT